MSVVLKIEAKVSFFTMHIASIRGVFLNVHGSDQKELFNLFF